MLDDFLIKKNLRFWEVQNQQGCYQQMLAQLVEFSGVTLPRPSAREDAELLRFINPFLVSAQKAHKHNAKSSRHKTFTTEK